MSLKQLIGETSGAALGYIAGNRRGLQIGRKVGKFLSKESEMAPIRRAGRQISSARTRRRRLSSGNTGSRRISKRKAYNYKRRNNKRMSRKASKKIKGIVQRVIECDFNSSTYQKKYGCQNSWVNTNGNTQIVVNNAQIDDANPAPHTAQALAFTPFNINRLLDAASVLYNGKARSIDPYLPGNFAAKGLSVNYQYCSYAMKMRNITGSIYDVEMIEVERKNGSNVDVFTQFGQSITNHEWIGTTPTVNANGLRPQQLSNFNKNYVVKSKKFTLHPGEEKRFFWTFKGCLDFSKFLDASGNLYNFAQKQGKEIMFIASPRIGTSTDGGVTVMHVGHLTGGNDKRAAIVYEIEEFYKLQQPAETLDANEGNFKAILNDFEVLLDTVQQGDYKLKTAQTFNGSA